MKITLCCSYKFFDRISKVKGFLENKGHKVNLPSMNSFDGEGEQSEIKIKFDLIKDHFRKIDKSDAILVLNYDKGNIKNYIGGNSFLEIGKAYDKGIPIYLLNPVPEVSF